jgi:hypothetical protein
MLSVLVVVLGTDYITSLGLSLRESEISLVVSSCVLNVS